MTKVLIVYATDYGNTKKVAESVAKGVNSYNNTTVEVVPAEEATIAQTEAADALILGSPVHMGSPDWRVKKFIDTVCSHLWMQDKMIGKVGGVFVSGGGFGSSGGGCELTMLALLNNLVELGMLIVPLPKNTPGYKNGGLQWGPYARSTGINMEQTGVSQESLEASFHHGANIARVASEVSGKQFFAKPQMATSK